MTRATCAALLIGLVFVVPSSGALPGSGKIAFTSPANDLYTVNADGSGLTQVRSAVRGQPRWSPDGSQLAYVASTGTVGDYELRVMNANGAGDRVIATGLIALSGQPWSPDGSRIAWGPATAEGDIYSASSGGGDVRRLTYDGLPKEAPVWSPTGSLLVYAASVVPLNAGLDYELFAVADGGRPPVQITSGGEGSIRNVRPSWSPSGSSIAFLRQLNTDSPAIYVVHPDATEQHRVVDISWVSTGAPAWSPDGAHIAYTDAVHGAFVRNGYLGQEIFRVNADGSGVRRLTELAPRLVTDDDPVWSPDGDRILFRRGAAGTLTTMNSDGTCESTLGTANALSAPSWQPVPGGPAAGEKVCRAVSVAGSGAPNRYRSRVFLYATVTNEGTEPLTNVIVTISNPHHDLTLNGLPLYGCVKRGAKAVCSIARIDRGQSSTVVALGMARRVGRDQPGIDLKLLAQLQVTAEGPLLPTQRETDVVQFTPTTCSASDPGRGRIDGTRFPDRICGRRGADDIHPLEGKDFVFAGAGPDHIFARDLYRDVIRCGPGKDIVIADRKDIVARDCEQVHRG